MQILSESYQGTSIVEIRKYLVLAKLYSKLEGKFVGSETSNGYE